MVELVPCLPEQILHAKAGQQARAPWRESRRRSTPGPAPCALQSSLKKEGRKTYADVGVHLWQNKPKIALGYKLSGIDSLGPVLYLEGVNLTNTKVKGCRIDQSLKKKHAIWANLSFWKVSLSFALDIITYSARCPTANYHIFALSYSTYAFFRCPVVNTINFECPIANFPLEYISEAV